MLDREGRRKEKRRYRLKILCKGSSIEEEENRRGAIERRDTAERITNDHASE